MTSRIHPLRRRSQTPVRLAVLVLALALAAACRRGGDGPAAAARIPLADSAGEGATLVLDSLGRAWIGRPGEMARIDSAGRAVERIDVPGEAAPRVLWSRGEGVVARAGGRALLLDSGKVRVSRPAAEPLARDPRGRWVYTATRLGGVLGLDPATLRPQWGWPDAGSRATAVAVGPLADRVYVALAGREENEVAPAVQVRDAISGRLLSVFQLDAPLSALEAGRDGALFGVGNGRVLKLRHGPGGLEREWIVSAGNDEGGELRLSPAGGRLAVKSGDEVRVLDATTGETVSRTSEAPLDVAYDGEGRLWMLYPREIRIAR